MKSIRVITAFILVTWNRITTPPRHIALMARYVLLLTFEYNSCSLFHGFRPVFSLHAQLVTVHC